MIEEHWDPTCPDEEELKFRKQADRVAHLAAQVIAAFGESVTTKEAWDLAKQAVFNLDAIYVLPNQYPSVSNPDFHRALKYLHSATGAIFQPIYK